MATTIRATEGVPAAYPAPPPGLSTAAAALSPAMIWQRLEGWIAHRWAARPIVWIVEGCGGWLPPLTPATIATTERWNGTAWEAVELPASWAGGYSLPGAGPYRFTGTVGDVADVPPTILEAYRRLAEYMVADAVKIASGARSSSITVPDVGAVTVERSPAWMAMALQNSGAADLLRTYRRA
jgi:hypothetical protein